MADTSRWERGRGIDFQKFLEEIRSFKNRLQNVDLARLEEERDRALESARKDSPRRGKSGSAPDPAAEARRFVEAEHENSKAILLSKFEKFESNLAVLAGILRDLGPLKDLEERLAAEGEKQRKLADELNVRRKVADRETEDLARDKDLLATAQQALSTQRKEVEAKFDSLDVRRRVQELDEREKDLQLKIQAYTAEMASLAKMREEFSKDMDHLGEKRAELDRDAESLKTERQKLGEERRSMREAVAREVAATFETFVRDLLRPPRK